MRELVRAGVDVTLFHRARTPLNPEHVAELGCHLLPIRDLSGLYWEQVAVPSALWKGRFDIYHAPTEHGVPLLSPCPVVLAIHSVTEDSYCDLIARGELKGSASDYLGHDVDRSSLLWWYWSTQIHRADHVVAPSEYTRDEIVKFFHLPPERVTVTPLAIDEKFNSARRAAETRAETLRELRVRKPYLLYVGGYETHKNIPGLLEVFKIVRRELPEMSLVLVGTSHIPAELRQEFDALGEQVRALLNLGPELLDLYDEAELFVSMSWRESFCLPAMEAMSRGTPVVMSAWGASREVAGDAACLVDPRNHTSVARAIVELLQSGRDEHSRRASERAALYRSWRPAAVATIELYERLGRRGTSRISTVPGARN